MNHTELIKARWKLIADPEELAKARLGYNYTYENRFIPTWEEQKRIKSDIKLGGQAKCTKEWLYVHKHRLPPETLSKERLSLTERCRMLTQDVWGAPEA